MNDEEWYKIKSDAEHFLSENQEKYEIIKNFQEQLVNLTNDNFLETIQFIKDHLDVFFKDHGTAISFIHIIMRSLVFNFQKFELILDIVIYFSTEIRNSNINDYELLKICDIYQNSQNYLFYKNFFTIEAITKQSYTDDLIFIKFLPEIEQYDSEYVKLRKKNLKLFTKPKMQNLLKEVESDPEKHIQNRTINYHPSLLHKSIRDDDISLFQSILSKNNFSVNHQIAFSYYERTQTIDSDLCLIQIAATYSAIKIFKFLWMQNDINLPENLLQYCFFGCNNEIIHLCENKLPHDGAILQTIYLNRLDLLDYYIENFEEKIVENNEVIKNAFVSRTENYDLYQCLNFDCLLASVDFLSIPIIQSCLPKIIFIVKNVDMKNLNQNSLFVNRTSLLAASIGHFDLFKFLYSQNDSDSKEIDFYWDCLVRSILLTNVDVFKFLFFEKIGNFTLDHQPAIFRQCIIFDSDLTNFILDFMIDEIESDSENKTVFDAFKSFIQFHHLRFQLKYYNEDAVFKMIKLFHFFDDNDDSITCFIFDLAKVASKKMILSLFDRLILILNETVLVKMKDTFDGIGISLVATFIQSKIKCE